MTGIVLCGGKNTRMKTNKAFLEVKGKPIIEIITEKFIKLFDEVIIVANDSAPFEYLASEAAGKKVSITGDLFPGKGPLGGIYSGLMSSGQEYGFVAACDLPFINERLVAYMTENAGSYDALVIREGEKYHPLFGVYSKNCAGPIREMLERDELKISGLFLKVKTRFITASEAEKYDPGLNSLVNLNTREDYEAAINPEVRTR